MTGSRQGGSGPSGLAVVDKPGGMTSHDVVARVRRLVGTRKVGHAGTLDPMATGVLLLGVNRGTRLLGHLALADKTYEATIRLGVATTTDDAEGEVTARRSAAALEEATVVAAVGEFLGEIDQVPSTVSAIKVDGRRAYALAREGKEVDLPARRVTIHSYEVVGSAHTQVSGPDGETTVLDLEVVVHCSTGTYVRALARDLGARLGVGGHLTRLRRTAVGPVTVERAVDLTAAMAEEALSVVPLEQAVPAFFACVTLAEDQARDVSFGRALELRLPAGGPVALMAPDGSFLALYQRDDAEDGAARATPVAVFV